MRTQWKNVLRSPRGQFILLAAMYLGGFFVAGAAVASRSQVFEKLLREKHPAASDTLRKSLIRYLDEPGHVKHDLSSDEFAAAYGLWIDGELEDPEVRFPQQWSEARPRELFGRLRGTLLVGNRRQQFQAMKLLPLIQEESLRSEIRLLRDYLLKRATRRNDLEFMEQLRQTFPAPRDEHSGAGAGFHER